MGSNNQRITDTHQEMISFHHIFTFGNKKKLKRKDSQIQPEETIESYKVSPTEEELFSAATEPFDRSDESDIHLFYYHDLRIATLVGVHQSEEINRKIQASNYRKN